MDKKSSPPRNPWMNLSTITNFDKGSSLVSTKLNKEPKKKNNMKSLTRNSFSSVVIKTLVDQFCKYVSEKDPTQSKRLQCFLSDTVVKMNLFDPFHEIDGFDNVRGKYMNAVCRLINVAKSITDGENSITRPIISSSSQYEDQFIEKCLIAEGGFGRVYKAVHKLDEVEYAIKKIIIKLGNVETIMSHLEEVKTLAKLNHENIVSYKQAWIEPFSTNQVSNLKMIDKSENSFKNSISKKKLSSSIKFSSKKSCRTNKPSSFSCKYFKSSHSKIVDLNNSKNSDSSSDILFLKENEFSDMESDSSDKYKNDTSSKNSESSSDIIFLKESETSETSDSNNKTYQKNSSNSSSSSDVSSKENEIESDSHTSMKIINSRSSTEKSNSSEESSDEQRLCQYSTSKNHYAVLYIQMTLCEKTLRHWLDERNFKPTPIHIINSIAQQILCGLNYIHSKNIVHHDIKPSNIFISTSGKLQVQLGDFGLACPLQRDSHKFAIGTSKYAAPEQLQGDCNPKSDIYSLGIVLLEILVPMKTSMEHIQMVKSFKTGKIPSSLITSHPKWTNILRQLIQINPSKRPSAEDLMKDVIQNKNLIFLQHEYYLLQTENNELQETIDKKNHIIEELQKKIAYLTSKEEKNIEDAIK